MVIQSVQLNVSDEFIYFILHLELSYPLQLIFQKPMYGGIHTVACTICTTYLLNVFLNMSIIFVYIITIR